MPDESATLPLYCAHCGSPLTVQVDPAEDAPVSEWICPSCRKVNAGKLGGRLVSVKGRYAQPPTHEPGYLKDAADRMQANRIEKGNRLYQKLEQTRTKR